MREILFRGKTYDGKWEQGDLRHGGYIRHDTETYIMRADYALHNIPVIPETVGQYTGLTDKNGKKIFEGDIIRTQPFYDRPYSSKRKEKQFVGVVEYDTYKFNGNRFYDEQVYDARWRVKLSEDVGKYNHCAWSDFWNCEVIGNIHDNPELLKGGAK